MIKNTLGTTLVCGILILTNAQLVKANGDSIPAPIKKEGCCEDSWKVKLSNVLSKLEIKGRAAAGYYKSGRQGTFSSGSFEVPEAKLQFSFQPDEINTVVMRANLNNAKFNEVDYLFLQSKDFLPFLKGTPFSLSSRLGRFKLGFGEETFSNNPVESTLPSNSAANAGVTDEGLELAGKIKLDSPNLAPLGWAASVSNGNTGTGTDTTKAKAWFGKLYHTPIDPLYLSVSFYNSGDLATAASEFSIAALNTIPAGGTHWKRRVWEASARYDFGKGKKPLDPPAYSDSKAFVRLSYGRFSDDVTGASGRNGAFGFVEGTYNITPKIYAAGRCSFMKLKGNTTASLNSIVANRYKRHSLGAGYRLSENVILKASYDWNKESGFNILDQKNNLFTALIAAQF